MSSKNKVIRYYEQEVLNMKYRVARASKNYTDSCESNFRFFMNYGFFSDEGKYNENMAYLKYADLYCKLLVLEQKLLNVKGVEACLGENL